MNSNLDKVRARARLLLAADKWRELLQFLERDVPALVAEVEQLQLELVEMKGQQSRYHQPTAEVLQRSAEIPNDRQVLTLKEFAHCIGVSEACVRRWTMERKIKVVRLGRLVRIPRTEVQRLMDEGAIPVRPSRTQP